MPLTIEKTEMEGLLIVKPHIFTDDRGIYKKYFEVNDFAKFGLDAKFTESSDIYSDKGALRGLHFQEKESQAKLIHVISGILYDVAVDLRPDSVTFGKVHEELLKAEDHKVLFIPEGFAHGFISLTDNTIFSYQCTGRYLPEYCGGILWNDPDLAINWPLDEYGIEKVICTDKDKNWPVFSEYCKERNI